VNQDIPQSSYFSPRNFRVAFPEIQ
jgi:hypothetical protein